MKPKALLVEDTPEFGMLGVRLLSREGYDVTHVTDGESGVAKARVLSPELVLLDVTLPGIDGFEVCRQIREFSDAYVIMVTARTDEIDRVVGLTVGADDYVTKPFSGRELSARIAAMRRRPRAKVDPDMRDFGSLRVDTGAREAVLDGRPLSLTRIEYDLLDKLSSTPRRSFTRLQLLDAVWGGDWYGDDHVVDVHVANLRRKLGETGSSPRFIHTVRGVGFRFEIPAADQ
jgi:DNA-binding response OmpR family regulator